MLDCKEVDYLYVGIRKFKRVGTGQERSHGVFLTALYEPVVRSNIIIRKAEMP